MIPSQVEYTPSTPRWDWYGASLEVDSPTALDLIGSALDAAPRDSRPRLSYQHAREFRAGDRTIAAVMWGGTNADPYVVGTSQDADTLATAIRTLGIPHRVSRADVCIDIDAAGAFDALAARLRELALKAGLRLELIQDPDRPERGRTLYVGSRKGRGYVRLYEKGKKDDPSRPNWVRFEVELKPGSRVEKAHLSTLEPVDALGLLRWVRGFVAEQFNFAAAAAPVRLANVGDDERALSAMVNQYGKVLARTAWRQGGWEAVGPLLRALMGSAD